MFSPVFEINKQNTCINITIGIIVLEKSIGILIKSRGVYNASYRTVVNIYIPKFRDVV